MAPTDPPRSIRKDRRSHSIHTGRRVVELRVRQTDDRRRGNCRSDLAVVSHDLHAPGTEHLTRGAGDYAFPKAGPGTVTLSLKRHKEKDYRQDRQEVMEIVPLRYIFLFLLVAHFCQL